MGFQNTTPPEDVPICEMSCTKGCEYADISNVVDLLSRNLAGPEILKKYFSIGELFYHQSSQLDKNISCFEAHIKRHHFHVKPLDELQLENWHKYLTYVEEQGNFDWTVKIYERCLIPCANYSEFWIRYVDFVDAKGGREIANDALERASKVFLKRIPAFHQYYSMFKEKIGDIVTASVPFLRSGGDSAVDAVENVSRRANMEKRVGNIEAAQELYDKSIKMAHEKQNLKLLSLLYISFARFTFVVTGSLDAAKGIFIRGIQQNPSKSIIEGFLDFMTMHGGKDHIAAVDCKMASLISPGSEISQSLSSHDREEISQLYLKFVDLFGNIHDITKAWDRHWKLFPHIMRPSNLCNYSSNEFGVQCKKSEPKGISTNSPNQSDENPRKMVSVIQLVENAALKSKSISLPKEVLKCEQKLYGQEDNEKERQESVAAEAILVQRTISEGSEIDITNKIFNESQNLAQTLHASSEYHETGIPIQSCVKKESLGNLEPPALDNLSIANALTCDNSTPQEVTSKKVGNKPEDECDASSIHSSHEKNMNCELKPQEKPQEETSLPFLASCATRTVTKTVRDTKFQEKMNTNQAFPVKTKHPQTASGGQLAQVYQGVHDIADPNHVLHGHLQTSEPQQWQAHAHMQNQSGGSIAQMSLTQSHISQSPWLNPHDPHGNHTQPQYQQAASQAYINPNLTFLGQHMQQPATVYTQDHQLQQASSSQTQIQVYQSVPQSDGQHGYHQNMQGFSPDIWQYYQNLYYLQQQQMQLDQQMNLNSYRQQWTDLSQASRSQQDVLENQEEKSRMQMHSDTQQDHNLDDKVNATNQRNNQQDKPEESTQTNQQSTQVMNFEQSQLLYLQQQQQFYLQQQHQYLMYLQQQHLLEQQQQQQQQQQQLLIFQQQQLLQLQHQQQMPIPSFQPEQLQCLQQQQQIPFQQHHRMQQEAAELKAVENSHYPQDKGDPVQSVGQLANSSSS